MSDSTVVASPFSEDSVDNIATRLQAELRGRVFDLQLTACERGVILRGQSRTYHAKQLAQHLVMATFRFPIAANEIVVC